MGQASSCSFSLVVHFWSLSRDSFWVVLVSVDAVLPFVGDRTALLGTVLCGSHSARSMLKGRFLGIQWV